MQVVLEFPVDDTAGGEKEDALTEMGFYVPKDAAGWGAGDQEHAAKVHANPKAQTLNDRSHGVRVPGACKRCGGCSRAD